MICKRCGKLMALVEGTVWNKERIIVCNKCVTELQETGEF